jgi:hypothetical protein
MRVGEIAENAANILAPARNNFPETARVAALALAKTGAAIASLNQFDSVAMRQTDSGANWVRPGSLKRRRRAVVGQLAT